MKVAHTNRNSLIFCLSETEYQAMGRPQSINITFSKDDRYWATLQPAGVGLPGSQVRTRNDRSHPYYIRTLHEKVPKSLSLFGTEHVKCVQKQSSRTLYVHQPKMSTAVQQRSMEKKEKSRYPVDAENIEALKKAVQTINRSKRFYGDTLRLSFDETGALCAEIHISEKIA